MRTIVSLAIVALSVAPLSANHWPQWRGPFGNGVSPEDRMPERWSDDENIAWRAVIGGAGVSSPIVVNDRVFVTSQLGAGEVMAGPRLGQGPETTAAERSLGARPGPVRFLVEAFARHDGSRLWRHEIEASGALTPVHDKHNLASASPVADGERIYAVFGTGQVVALDEEGSRLWLRDLGRDFGPWDIHWGNGSSPVAYEGALIVVAYHPSAASIVALDGRTGRERWKVERPRGTSSYSTPLLVAGERGDELIVNSSTGIEAFDPRTGERRWWFDERNDFPIPAAAHHDGVLYLSRGYRSGPYAAIRTGGRGDIAGSHVLWHVPTGAPYIASVVHYEGLLYLAGDVGIVTGVDAATGERVWRERLGGVYTASPVAGDGKVYLMSESGETLVLRAGRTPDVIARNRIEGRVLASPAIAPGQLIVRLDDQLVAIGAGAAQ